MCSLEFPDLETSIWQEYQSYGIQVVGVNGTAVAELTDSIETIELFQEITGVTFPLGTDLNDSYLEYREVTAPSPYPIDVIIAPDGTIAYLGYEADVDAMSVVLDSLL